MHASDRLLSSERDKVRAASPVNYPQKADDNEKVQARLQQWADGAADAKAADDDEKAATKTGSGRSSRSDSFSTTVGKTFVRTAMPIIMRLLESMLKSLLKRGGGGLHRLRRRRYRRRWQFGV